MYTCYNKRVQTRGRGYLEIFRLPYKPDHSYAICGFFSSSFIHFHFERPVSSTAHFTLRDASPSLSAIVCGHYKRNESQKQCPIQFLFTAASYCIPANVAIVRNPSPFPYKSRSFQNVCQRANMINRYDFYTVVKKVSLSPVEFTWSPELVCVYCLTNESDVRDIKNSVRKSQNYLFINKVQFFKFQSFLNDFHNLCCRISYNADDFYVRCMYHHQRWARLDRKTFNGYNNTYVLLSLYNFPSEHERKTPFINFQLNEVRSSVSRDQIDIVNRSRTFIWNKT